MEVLDSASIFVPSTSCTDMIQIGGTNAVLTINTNGWLYNAGNCVASAGSDPLRLTVKKAYLVSGGNEYMFYLNNAWNATGKSQSSSGTRFFDCLLAYNTFKADAYSVSGMYWSSVGH